MKTKCKISLIPNVRRLFFLRCVGTQLKSQLTILQPYRDWNKVYQAQWLGLWTRSCLHVVFMYWTHLVLVWPTANIYSASPVKHHATGRQKHPNQTITLAPSSQWVSNSFMLSSKQRSRTSNFNVLYLMQPGIERPTSRMPGEPSTTTLPGRGTWGV